MEVVDFLTIGGESDEVASSIVVDGSDIFISGSFAMRLILVVTLSSRLG